MCAFSLSVCVSVCLCRKEFELNLTCIILLWHTMLPNSTNRKNCTLFQCHRWNKSLIPKTFSWLNSHLFQTYQHFEKKEKKTYIILVDSVDNSCYLGRCACSACVACCVLATNSNWDEKKWKKMKENEKTKHNKMKGMKRSNGGFRNTRAGEVGERADGFHCLLSVAWQFSLSTWNLFIAHWTCSSKSESTLTGTLARTKF